MNAPPVLNEGMRVGLDAKGAVLETRIEELKQLIAINCDSEPLAELYKEVYDEAQMFIDVIQHYIKIQEADENNSLLGFVRAKLAKVDEFKKNLKDLG